jgi:RNA 2',3'-cyclic 3'-phosphodiesterase
MVVGIGSIAPPGVTMASDSGLDKTRGPVASTGSPQSARVFVALKIASAIADELAKVVRELERFPVRLIVPADIHLTRVPPRNKVSIPDAAAKLRSVADKCDDFTQEFWHVGYGPEPRRPGNPSCRGKSRWPLHMRGRCGS